MGIEGAREPARGPGGAHHPSFSTHKMRYTAQAGLGELNAQIAEANRLFRLSELGENPAPHVITLSDVTRGIISDQVDQQKIQGLILDTPVDFSAKTQTHKLNSAVGRLISTLRHSYKHIDSDTRMELARRALAYWKRNNQTDYGKAPTVRYEKSMRHTIPSNLFKSAGHKYISRKPNGHGGYDYVYPHPDKPSGYEVSTGDGGDIAPNTIYAYHGPHLATASFAERAGKLGMVQRVASIRPSIPQPSVAEHASAEHAIKDTHAQYQKAQAKLDKKIPKISKQADKQIEEAEAASKEAARLNTPEAHNKASALHYLAVEPLKAAHRETEAWKHNVSGNYHYNAAHLDKLLPKKPLIKSAGYKYISKKPNGRGGYDYVYAHPETGKHHEVYTEDNGDLRTYAVQAGHSVHFAEHTEHGVGRARRHPNSYSDEEGDRKMANHAIRDTHKSKRSVTKKVTSADRRALQAVSDEAHVAEHAAYDSPSKASHTKAAELHTNAAKHAERLDPHEQLVSHHQKRAAVHRTLAEGMKKSLPKSGEGSRGGKIIGHTKSGKPIYSHESYAGYSHKDTHFKPTSHYSKQDHRDAQEAHAHAANKESRKHIQGDKSYDHKKVLLHNVALHLHRHGEANAEEAKKSITRWSDYVAERKGR